MPILFSKCNWVSDETFREKIPRGGVLVQLHSRGMFRICSIASNRSPQIT